MKKMIYSIPLATLALSSAVSLAETHNKHGLLPEDIVTLKRVSSPALAPNGEQLAYVLRSTDMDADKGTYDIYLVSTDGKGKPKQVTTDKAADTSPKWSADGQHLYFLSSRSGSNQLWQYSLKSGKKTQISDFPVSISSYKLSSNNDHVVFSASVFPDCDTLSCSAKRFKAAKDSKAKGKLYSKMFVRHWDTWLDGSQSQLFSSSLKAGGLLKTAKKVSGAVNGNVPSNPFGGEEEYTISPDGKTVIFAARIADEKEPISTNFDLYEVSIDGGKAKNITSENTAWDTQPVFSPDGKKLAWLAMRRPGFEADRLELKIRDLKTGKTEAVTKNWDRSFSSFSFSPNGKTVYLNGNNIGNKSLWALDLASGKHTTVIDKGYVGSFIPTSDSIIYQYDDLQKPADFYRLDLNNNKKNPLTEVNKEAFKTLSLGEFEQFSFKGWNDEKVYGYVVKPHNFDPKKKYPLAFLIHGGPQGSFGNHFHYRWNPQTYTAEGYVAVMIDFHGSTGYGQAFTDSISGDWGGKPLEDLQKGMKFIEKEYSYIDTENACALGASYGGYMINWIAGNWSNQFKCLVNHDGVFDNRMMYYATEELWFVEWENGGPHYQNPENFEKFNPINHVKNWKTPMFVIQGDKDYRVPTTQSLATFTALQRQGIPSQMLVFEHENHWVLKPNNSQQWHQEVNAWLNKWLNADAQ